MASVICFFGTYVVSEGYPINQVLINGLRQSGGRVLECHIDLWQGFLHEAFGRRRFAAWPGYAARMLVAYSRLVWRYWRTGSHQFVVVGYPGYADIVLARILNLWRRRTLVLVSFISLYDTIVIDREKVARGSWQARLLYGLDRLAFRCADVVLVDTYAVADYFAEVFTLDRGKFQRSMVGNVFDRFAPVAIEAERHPPIKVLFFGTYVPLHGIEYIVEAADLLRDEDFEFALIGRGQLYEGVRKDVTQRRLKRVHLIDEWINTEGLVEEMKDADVCLGIFGTTSKAARVIPYKVFGALALGRPVITRDSPAVREMLIDGESALLCEAGSGQALAAALRRLRDERGLAARLATAGYARYRECGSAAAIGRDLLRLLDIRSDG